MPRLVVALGGGDGERQISLTVPADAAGFDARAGADAPAPPAAARRTAELFEELRGPLCRYLASLGVPPAEADEIAQETFLRLYRHLDARGDEANLRGWLFRVAQNLARDRRRRARPAASAELDEAAEAWQAADPQAGPEQRLLEAERLDRLHAAVQRLPPAHQQCLRLRAAGLRYREIAAALDVGVSTVADWIHQALARLEKECR